MANIWGTHERKSCTICWLDGWMVKILSSTLRMEVDPIPELREVRPRSARNNVSTHKSWFSTTPLPPKFSHLVRQPCLQNLSCLSTLGPAHFSLFSNYTPYLLTYLKLKKIEGPFWSPSTHPPTIRTIKVNGDWKIKISAPKKSGQFPFTDGQ